MSSRSSGYVEQHYTVAEVAKLVGLTYQTMLLKVQRGEFSRVRRLSRKAVRIPASSVNAWLERHTMDVST